MLSHGVTKVHKIGILRTVAEIKRDDQFLEHQLLVFLMLEEPVT